MPQGLVALGDFILCPVNYYSWSKAHWMVVSAVILHGCMVDDVFTCTNCIYFIFPLAEFGLHMLSLGVGNGFLVGFRYTFTSNILFKVVLVTHLRVKRKISGLKLEARCC